MELEGVTAMPKTIDKGQITTVVEAFLEEFERWFAMPNGPTVADVEKCLAKDLKARSNGELILKNSSQYVDRVNLLRSRYSAVRISHLLGDVHVWNHSGVVQYIVNFTGKDGKPTELYFMVIVTLEDGKIVQWEQVTHERGLRRWDQA
jgi:hypothetical protein